MPADRGVRASFRDPAPAAAAIRALRARGFAVRAVMPAPFPEVLAAIGRPRSRIDRIALAGALAGVAGGALLTAATSRAWPLVTGGMPIVSVPPFAVVCFETTLLAGALATLAALAWGSWRGRRPVPDPDPADAGEDRIAVLAAGGDGEEAERILRARGGEGVRRVA
jgi:hypothetical protein